jgi:putative endonuclease
MGDTGPVDAARRSILGVEVLMAAKDDLGRRGEQAAADYLAGRGMQVVDRNWRCAQGEIDLVARDGAELVFVEVKTRSGTGFGHPLEAITVDKLARLRRLAAAWCAAHPGPHGLIRIDAVAVLAPASSGVSIEHVKRVF